MSSLSIPNKDNTDFLILLNLNQLSIEIIYLYFKFCRI